MSVLAEIAKLEDQIARDKGSDRRARCTDAATLMRRAANLLEGAIDPTTDMIRAAALLIEAADLLTGEEP